MPTEAKRTEVADLAERIGRSTIAIATDFTGLKVNQLTELRRRLKERDAEYRVIKNRLAALAATQAGNEAFRELLEGVTGIVFGYGEPESAAKAVDEYIKQTRAALRMRNAIMGGDVLSAAQVSVLAALPSKEELLARLLGQLNAPVAGLVNVLSGPVRGLAIVLQRHAEQLAGSA